MFHGKDTGWIMIVLTVLFIFAMVTCVVIWNGCMAKIEPFESSTIDFMLNTSVNKKVVTMLDSYNIFFMYSLNQTKAVLKLTDFAKNTIVSYSTEAEKFIFQVLVKAHGISDDVFVLDRNNENANVNTTIHCHLGKNEATLFFQRLNLEKQLTIIDYNDVDKAVVAFFIPFVRYKGIDLKTLMPKQDQVMLTLSALVIDDLVTDENNSARITINHRMQEKINFYHLFFPWSDEKAVEAVEGFTDLAVTIPIDHPIQVISHVVNKYDEFKVIIVEPIPLCKPGDIVILTNQINNSDNGRYIASANDTLQSMYSLSFYDNFTVVESGKSNLIFGQAKKGVVPRDKSLFWFTDLDVPGTVSADGFAIIHAKPDQDNKYECVSNSTVVTRQACESEYDGLGQDKIRNVWDKRCTRNSECPFYNADKNRGTCSDNGFCELPLGVKRVGYTRYSGTPYCHGCTDVQDKLHTCCSGNNPDYAYPYDYMERLGSTGIQIEYFIPDTTNMASNSPIHELNDTDFYERYFANLHDAFIVPPDDELISVKPASVTFLKDSCNALLPASYEYKFGKCEQYRKSSVDNLVYFDATICIHAPAKEKGKVIKYNCCIENDTFKFANIQVVGSISEDQIVMTGLA